MILINLIKNLVSRSYVKSCKKKEFVMKKNISLVIVIILVFSMFFMGCEENSDGSIDEAELTDEELIAWTTFINGYYVFTLYGLDNGVYDEENDDRIVSGDLTVSDTVYTFDDCVFNNLGVNITLSGTLTYIEPNYTYTNFKLIGPTSGYDEAAIITAILNGSYTLTGDDDGTGTGTLNITHSGVTDTTRIVVVVMTVVNYVTEAITSATINGLDYTTSFSEVFESLLELINNEEENNNKQ